MHLNETPDDVQPTNAVMAVFDDLGPADTESALTAEDLDGDRLWIWQGPQGLRAYEDRASAFVRFFDDTEDRTSSWLADGKTVALIHCVDDEQAATVQRLASDAGAAETLFFGESTHTT